MRVPKPEDFQSLEEWGLISNPCEAAEDYSEEKVEKRWENNYHCESWDEYEKRRAGDQGQGSQEFYESMERRINRTKWEYLKRRKAWYIPPVGWGEFASPGTARILDLGCGDGDVTQRVAEFIAGRWEQANYDGFPLEIIGVDLNAVRIQNAKQMTHSPHRKITLTFETGNAAAGLGYTDDFFDYTISTGVLEILDDNLANSVLDEITRLSAKGIYIEDLLDEFPGGYPRENLPELLSKRGFETRANLRLFQQPFSHEGSTDPLEIWPILVVQVLYADATSPSEAQDEFVDT